MRIQILILISILFILACSNNPKKINNSKIVFLSNREAPQGEFDIFLLNLETDSLSNLTTHIKEITSISHPVLSPDGSKVLFVRYGAQKTLELIDIKDQSNLTLREIKTDKPNASFSIDGEFILFTDKINNKKQIIRIQIDGTKEKILSDINAENFDPCISPNGLKIALIKKIGKEYSLCLMDNNGKNLEILTKLPGTGGHPSFSPDNKNIVFHAFNKGSSNIYRVNIDNKKIELIYHNNVRNIDPIFSPDGQHIAFLSNIRGMKYLDIITLDIKTKSVKVISNKINYINQNPVFSSDGEKIIFESIIYNNSDIYMVDVNGKNLKNKSNHASWDCSPYF